MNQNQAPIQFELQNGQQVTATMVQPETAETTTTAPQEQSNTTTPDSIPGDAVSVVGTDGSSFPVSPNPVKTDVGEGPVIVSKEVLVAQETVPAPQHTVHESVPSNTPNTPETLAYTGMEWNLALAGLALVLAGKGLLHKSKSTFFSKSV